MALKIDRWDDPQIKNQGVETGPSGQLPNVSGGMAQGIVEGGQKLSSGFAHAASVLKQEKESADTYASAEREVQYARDATDLLYKGDEAFLNQKNQGAIDTVGVHEKLAKLREKYGEGLEGDALKKYERRTTIRTLGYQEQIEKHASSERRALYTSTTEAIAKESIDSAVKVYNDPTKVEQAIGLALPIIQKHLATDLKLPADVIGHLVKQYEGEVYGAVLAEYEAKEEFGAGQKYLGAVKDSLPAKVATSWTERFTKASKEQRIEKVGSENWDHIAFSATDPVSHRFNENAARAAFAGLDVATRALTDKDFDHRVAVQNHLQAQADVQRLARIHTDIRATGGLNKGAKDFADLDDDGRSKAEGMLETYKRQNRGDHATDRAMQAQENAIALNDYLSIPPSERLKYDDAKLKAEYPGVDDRGFTNLTRHREQARVVVDKGQEVGYGQATARLEPVLKLIRGTGKSPSKMREAQDLAAEFSTWYSEQTKGDHNPKESEVMDWIGSKALLLDIPLGKDLRAHKVDPEKAKGYKPAAMEEQTPEARAYLARHPWGAATPAGAAQVATAAQGPKPRIITNGTQRGVLQPGKPMPAGWKDE